MEHGLGVTAPKTHVPRAKANRPVLLVECARSTRGGLRVGVVDSLERGFVWGAQAMAGLSGAVCGCSNTSGGYNAVRP
jgi:hypothetical protein